MAKIQRKTQKIFAGASNIDEKAVFGSMNNTPAYSNDVEELQSDAYEQGWQNAVTLDYVPFLEEMNGVQYGLSSQIAYVLQQGIAEYDSATTYYKNSFAQSDGIIYKSLTDDNLGNSVTDTTNWQAYVDLALSTTSNNAIANSVVTENINELDVAIQQNASDIATNKKTMDDHISDKNNPHNVTAAQLGLASAYNYKGTVSTYDDLPTSGQKVGDVYNIEQADESKGIPAGANVAWNGTTWDLIGGDLSSILTDIDNLQSATLTNATNITTLEGRMDTAEDNITTLQTATMTNATNISELGTSKQDKLTAGTNITISDDNVITASVSAGVYYEVIE